MNKYCNCKEPSSHNDCCLNQDCGLRIKTLAEKYGETLGLLDIAERKIANLKKRIEALEGKK